MREGKPHRESSRSLASATAATTTTTSRRGGRRHRCRGLFVLGCAAAIAAGTLRGFRRDAAAIRGIRWNDDDHNGGGSSSEDSSSASPPAVVAWVNRGIRWNDDDRDGIGGGSSSDSAPAASSSSTSTSTSKSSSLLPGVTDRGYNDPDDDEGDDDDRRRPPPPLVLPEKLIVVTGLESSGTNFVSKIVSDAFGKRGYRSACGGGRGRDDGTGVWVQHVSQPTGRSCEQAPLSVQPVILPGVCSAENDRHFHPACVSLAKAANVTMDDRGRARCADRYVLDLVSNREFYRRKLGVKEVWYVIVVRERSISRAGRFKSGYCRNETTLLEEERIGSELIDRAIYRYVLEEDYDQDDHDHDRRRSGRRRKLGSSSSSSSTLTSGNNVLLVSYESLLKLKGVYVRMIREALGVDDDGKKSIPMPVVDENANAKYVGARPPPLRTDGREAKRPAKRVIGSGFGVRNRQVFKPFGEGGGGLGGGGNTNTWRKPPAVWTMAKFPAASPKHRAGGRRDSLLKGK